MTLWDVEVWTIKGGIDTVDASYKGVLLQSRIVAVQGNSHELMVRNKELPYAILDSVYVNGLEFLAPGISVTGTSFPGEGQMKWQQWRITPHVPDGQAKPAAERLPPGPASAEAGAGSIVPPGTQVQ